MKKQLAVWLVLSAVLMLLYPLAVVLLAPAESSMALCFLLFYLLAPAFAIAAGIAAGRNIRSMWILSVLPSFFFVLGTWLCFDMGEPDFLIYAAVYLFLALIAMFFSRLMHHIRSKGHRE